MAANPAGADVCPAESERGLRWLRVFAGTLAQVAEVRRFVACLLAECPARDALVSCVSELAANAVVHTGSGDGGFFTVEVSCPRSGVARVSVTDAGGPTEPAVGAPVDAEAADEDVDGLPVCGLGLALVAASASCWGYYYSASPGRTVWAEASWPVAVLAAHRAPWVTAPRDWADGGGAA
jgi:anti-sigma regulatory factor (Ser/Thr protein kinase)